VRAAESQYALGQRANRVAIAARACPISTLGGQWRLTTAYSFAQLFNAGQRDGTRWRPDVHSARSSRAFHACSTNKRRRKRAPRSGRGAISAGGSSPAFRMSPTRYARCRRDTKAVKAAVYAEQTAQAKPRDCEKAIAGRLGQYPRGVETPSKPICSRPEVPRPDRGRSSSAMFGGLFMALAAIGEDQNLRDLPPNGRETGNGVRQTQQRTNRQKIQDGPVEFELVPRASGIKTRAGGSRWVSSRRNVMRSLRARGFSRIEPLRRPAINNSRQVAPKRTPKN